MQLTAEMFSSILSSLKSDRTQVRSNERRTNPRVGVWAKLRIMPCENGKSGKMIDAHVRDLSPGGICVCLPKPLPAGSYFIAHLPGCHGDSFAVLYEVRHSQNVAHNTVAIGARLERILVSNNHRGPTPDVKAA